MTVLDELFPLDHPICRHIYDGGVFTQCANQTEGITEYCSAHVPLHKVTTCLTRYCSGEAPVGEWRCPNHSGYGHN